MRRKPSNGGYNNNQHRRQQRYQPGGGDQRQQHGHGRPRRNYGAAREKYLNQAREALAAGDRVAAENWFQHADHCYRMMVEEGHFQPRPQHSQHQPNGEAEAPHEAHEPQEHFVSENTNQLPAFITANPEQSAPADPATIQNWEDRDA